MRQFFPRISLSRLRLFSACLMSLLMLMAPVAPLAASVTRTAAARSEQNAERQLAHKLANNAKKRMTPREALENALFVNPLAQKPSINVGPNISATLRDSFVDANSSTRADPGSIVTYTAVVTNTGSDASGVSFTDTPDPNTTLVGGSLKISPLAFADSYNTKQNTQLSVAAAGVLANDTGTPAPTAVPIAAGPTTQPGGVVTLNADGSFTYNPPAGFTGADTFTYTATNGQAPNDTALVTINVNANQAPVLANIEPGTLGYGNASPPVQITNTLTVADADDTNIESATVSITNNFVNGEDVLSFTNQNGITGNYVAATGILTLTGSATLLNYQTALRSITYSDSAGSPTQSVRTITFVVNDGDVNSNTQTRNINVSSNSAPVVTAGATLNYTENDPATVIDNTITVTDSDSPNLTGATAQITGNYQSAEDVLSFVNQLGITGGYNSANGTLTLTGTTTVANYQTALRAIKYNNTSESPSTAARTVTWIATDGITPSTGVTSTINVTSVNDAPVLANIEAGALAYTENDVATAVSSTITVSDLDSTNLTGATVQITGNYASAEDVLSFVNQLGITGSYNPANGTMTLSGSSSVANYQTALRAVKYNNTSESPSTLARTVTFQVNDGAALNNLSNTKTRNINVTSVNDAPVLANIEVAAVAYNENDPATALTGAITVSDVDSTNLTGATVQITGNYQSAEDVLSFVNQLGITGSYNSANGTMTLSGSSSVANYQTALRAVKYNNTSESPSTLSRTVTFQVNDGAALNNLSNTQTRNINVASVNDAPVLANIEAGALAYTENAAATAVTSTITVSDVDSTNLGSATVQITGNYQSAEDVLSFVNQLGITGSYNSANGTMTLSGTTTVANYQTALRAVKYNNTSENPSTLARTVTFQVNDGGAVNNLSNTQTRNINVTSVNDAPVVDLNGTGTGGINTTATFTEDGGAIVMAGSTDVTDVDSNNLVSATITLTNRPDGALESLSVDVTGTLITADAYVPGTGVLFLHGTDTVANYQQVLRTAKYNNTDQDPDTTARSVTFKANDGATDSAVATATITVIAVNDAPVLGGVSGGFTYTENDAATAIAPAITVSDVDNATLTTGTVTISANYQSAQDVLSFTNNPGTMGNILATGNTGGVLTLTSAGGTATLAQWQAAFAAVKYNNSSDDPSTLTRTVTFQVDDGQSVNHASNTPTRTITITAVNDPPTANAFASLPAQAGIPISYPIGKLGGTDVEAGTTITIDTVPINQTNGTVTINANGSFTFTPLPGSVGINTASFQYRVYDNGNPNGGPSPTGGVFSSYVTVSFTVAGPAIYFVKQSAVGLGNCTLLNECTLATALATIGAATNTSIFIEDAGAYTNSVTLNSNGSLIGQGITGFASFDALYGIGVPAQGTLAARPLLAQASPTITVSSAGVNVVNLNSAGTTNAVRGLVLTTGTGTTKAISGTSFGTLTTSDLVITGSGPALDLTTGSLAGSFTSISSSGGANGIKLTTVNSAASISLGSGALSGATADEFFVNGGTVTLTYAGTINTTAAGAHPVNISNKTSSGNVTFTGAISAGTSSAGVNLDNNDGALITFRGGLQLTTTTNTAFNAINGGTIEVCDESPCNPAATGGLVNTLTTTTGTALNVNATTISSNKLEFRSITAGTGAGGPTNGIILNTTGASGGLTVTGTGTTAGTGGTIQNTVQGALFTSTSNLSLSNMNFTNADSGNGTVNNVDTSGFNSAAQAAINMSSVTTATFTNLSVTSDGTTGGAQVGINGNIVSGFTLANSTVSGFGDVAQEGDVKLWNLTGTCSVTNSNFSFVSGDTSGGENLFEVRNSTASALTLTVSGSTFQNTRDSTSGSGGLAVTSTSSGTVNLNVYNNDFLNLKTSGVETFAKQTSTMNLTVTDGGVVGNGNNFDPQNTTNGGRAVGVNTQDTAHTNFNINRNPKIWGSAGPIINIYGQNSSVTNGYILNNPDIRNNSTAGSPVGSPIYIHPQDNATGFVKVSGNTIITKNDPGIFCNVVGDGVSLFNAALDVELASNNITTNGTNTFGIELASGASNSDATNVYAYIHNNAVTGPPANGNLGFGILSTGGASEHVYLQNFTAGGQTTWNNNGNTPINSYAELINITSPAAIPAGHNGGTVIPPSNATAMYRPETNQREYLARDENTTNPAVTTASAQRVAQPVAPPTNNSKTVKTAKAEPSTVSGQRAEGRGQRSAVSRRANHVSRTLVANHRATTRALLTPFAPPPPPITVNANIGTLPGGKSVTITFQVTLNVAMPLGTTQVSTQGKVFYTGGPAGGVLTDDPDVPPNTGEHDPTVTPIDAPTAATSTVSGRILDDNGNPVEGAVIRLSGAQNRKTITDANGNYNFAEVDTNGFYTVTPARVNYNFAPATRAFSALGAHTEASFAGTFNGNHQNPLDTTEYFVRQQYVDFLGREPEEKGFNDWTDTINNCAPGDASCDRIHVSEMFFRSEEFQQRGYFVYRFYSTVLGQKPDYAAFTPDLARVSGFLDATQLEAAKAALANDFVTRPAFARYATMTNAQYVDALAQTAGVTLGNRQALVDSLEAGTLTRAQALRQIAESGEVYAKYYNQAFVVMEYFGYLRRDPDALYLNWVDVLDQGGDSRHMVEGFVDATEYRNRFKQ
jgi:Bacterial Ig domain/Carboxypeptidase regulatory-like domain